MQSNEDGTAASRPRPSVDFEGPVDRPISVSSAALAADKETERAPMLQGASTQEGLPVYFNKWVGSLRTAFAADYQSLLSTLQRDYAEKLDALQRKHLCERNSLDAELASLRKKAAEIDGLEKSREVALGRLAQQFLKRRSGAVAAHAFHHWRTARMNIDSDRFKLHIAESMFDRTMLRRALSGWQSAVKLSWKATYKDNIQESLDQQVAAVRKEYEAQISELRRQIANQARLHQEDEQKRRNHDEEMRKAFMRGLSALNMETMVALQQVGAPASSSGVDQDGPAELPDRNIFRTKAALNEHSATSVTQRNPQTVDPRHQSIDRNGHDLENMGFTGNHVSRRHSSYRLPLDARQAGPPRVPVSMSCSGINAMAASQSPDRRPSRSGTPTRRESRSFAEREIEANVGLVSSTRPAKVFTRNVVHPVFVTRHQLASNQRRA